MINCLITSAQKTTLYKDLRSVVLPAFFGELEIAPGHAEAFILLKQGKISLWQKNGQKKLIEIRAGQCYVKDNLVTIIL